MYIRNIVCNQKLQNWRQYILWVYIWHI